MKTTIKRSRFAVSFRRISRLCFALFFLRWFKVVHICIQVIGLHKVTQANHLSKLKKILIFSIDLFVSPLWRLVIWISWKPSEFTLWNATSKSLIEATNARQALQKSCQKVVITPHTNRILITQGEATAEAYLVWSLPLHERENMGRLIQSSQSKHFPRKHHKVIYNSTSNRS